jgi:hypothetical protein
LAATVIGLLSSPEQNEKNETNENNDAGGSLRVATRTVGFWQDAI